MKTGVFPTKAHSKSIRNVISHKIPNQHFLCTQKALDSSQPSTNAHQHLSRIPHQHYLDSPIVLRSSFSFTNGGPPLKTTYPLPLQFCYKVENLHSISLNFIPLPHPLPTPLPFPLTPSPHTNQSLNNHPSFSPC